MTDNPTPYSGARAPLPKSGKDPAGEFKAAMDAYLSDPQNAAAILDAIRDVQAERNRNRHTVAGGIVGEDVSELS